MYRCCLVRRTSYACSPAIDDSVLIGAVRECIVVSGSAFAPRPLLGVGAPSVLYPNLPRVCRFWRLSCLLARRVYEKQLSDVWSEESFSWVLALAPES